MVKLNKIYTRTGDGGETGLVDGSRLPKNAPRMAAIGDVDELNSAIGVAITHLHHGSHANKPLARVQNDLFDLGADFATPGEDFTPSEMALRIVSSQVEWLESEIDRLNGNLKPLDSFILPGGCKAAAALHLARAICRRAERSSVAAAQDVALNPSAMAYLNRLSDYLFTLARHLNDDGAGDVKWRPGANR